MTKLIQTAKVVSDLYKLDTLIVISSLLRKSSYLCCHSKIKQKRNAAMGVLCGRVGFSVIGRNLKDFRKRVKRYNLS